MLKIVITDRAEQSLFEIIDFYLIGHSVERAQKILNSMDDSFIKIANSPLHYPVCFDVKVPQENIRQFILYNTFKIIFKVRIDCIEIIEILHGSRNNELLKDIG